MGDTVDVRYLRDKPDFAVIFEYVYDSNHKEDVYGFVLSLAACIFVFLDWLTEYQLMTAAMTILLNR